MAVHSSGDGAAWPEDLDVDQPHGLDYRQFNHIAVGVRKRIGQEHTTFADSTVGGIHKPGGSAVLGMEITDTAVDPTDLVVADGTYRGHGIVWAYDDASNSGTLWCATAAAGISTTGDWTLMKLHPDDQWAGGDVTWTGHHQFDSSADFLNPTDFTGPNIFCGTVRFDSTCVDFQGDVSIVQGLACGSDVEVAGDFSVDGTADFGDDVAFVADISVDATAAFNDVKVTGDISSGQVIGAWVTFDATKDNSLQSSYNVASVNRQAEGDYSITFTSALADTNYAVVATCQGLRDDFAASVTIACVSRATTGCRLNMYNNAAAKADVSGASVLMLVG